MIRVQVQKDTLSQDDEGTSCIDDTRGISAPTPMARVEFDVQIRGLVVGHATQDGGCRAARKFRYKPHVEDFKFRVIFGTS